MTLVNRLILGGQHTPFWGGQHAPFQGGQLKPFLGGQYERFFQLKSLKMSLNLFLCKIGNLPSAQFGAQLKPNSLIINSKRPYNQCGPLYTDYLDPNNLKLF